MACRLAELTRKTKETDISMFDRKKVQHYGFWFSVDKDYYTKNKSNRSNKEF